MNLLIPNSWLREFLKTSATYKQLKDYLSLCGPDIARIEKIGNEIVFDIEVTTNRPDSMSVLGIAREAAAILPRFGITAKLINDPYSNFILANEVRPGSVMGSDSGQARMTKRKSLNIKTDPKLNPRWTSIVLDHIEVGPSPKWLQKKLELTGIRPLNNIIDITNYLMRAYGQPAHAFDYDSIKPGKNGVQTMILRASKKGEKITTLDGKTHTLPGGDIVIEDGAGRLIDLCGIMGADNSSIRSDTKTIVLFLQTYDPVQIRKTSMSLGHRTEAATLFEKGLDPELVLPALFKGIELVKELASGKVASQLYDLYESPYKTYTVSVTRTKLDSYVGAHLTDKEIENILRPLGFNVILATPPSSDISDRRERPGSPSTTLRINSDSGQARMTGNVTVTVPSYRQDIEIDVDIIEEIARIYGYHNIKTKLPEGIPPIVFPDPILSWEEEIKVRLRDWGYTETYTYSMISEELMDIFNLDKQRSYKISNPLSSEWVYMRPTLTPSLLVALKENLHFQENIKLFELSMVYKYKPENLPQEEPNLLVVWKGDKFLEAKGLAEILFSLFGIPFPEVEVNASKTHLTWYTGKVLQLGNYGTLGIMDPVLLTKLDIKVPVTRLYLDVAMMVKDAKSSKVYIPIPKFPPVIEDMSFVLPEKTPVGVVLHFIKNIAFQIHHVELVSQFENTASFRLYYLDDRSQLRDTDILKLRHLVKTAVEKRFLGKLKA